MPLSGNVLLTGGSGFLGRAIIRAALLEGWPCKFTVYSRDETKQWELKRKFPQVTCILGDVVRDIDRLISAMAGHDTVIHCAAVKYIPEAEWNVSETIDVNVVGSRNVALAARAAGVKTVVGISTDKACAPLNTYGMTKGLMERYFSEADRVSAGTRFITVRYGNVVGSTGSVIPVFRNQIKELGKVRITHPSMTRFWLSPLQAVHLVDWAVDHIHEYGGQTIIRACDAMSIGDLAKAVWKSTGRELQDYQEEITGIRPGEKLHESLWNEQEDPRIENTSEDWYFSLKPPTMAGFVRDSSCGYCSDRPMKAMQIDEMVNLIKVAEAI